ncbi:MAG TPA: tryptophan--tRNA ligase [Dehalococcoidia bacterium]|nr:tryptophan--tRNA ligase [Dehalococcoidia bacterium]
MAERPRILTGVRPTGSLHLGHYAGALEQWIAFQEEFESFWLIADYQVSDYADDLDRVRDSVFEVALDWLAVGLDPDKGHYVIESLVPQHAELTTWLSWFIGMGRLQRNPTLKAEMDDVEAKMDSVPVAFFNYPVMQVANILMPKAHAVPVGDDQLPHVEMTREVARRFNKRFGETFPVPKGITGDVPRLVGLDGDAKMSKSRENAIDLKDDAETVMLKVRGMFTDPTRLRATDPGHVEGNPVFMYHDAFNPNTDEVQDLKDRYVKGTVGDVEVKEKLTIALNNLLDPIRERRAAFAARPDYVREVLEQGSAHAREVADGTMADVREALKLNYLDK